MEQVVSKKKNYNHSIKLDRDYGVGIETEYEMYGKNTREDAVRFVLETNAFFQSWNKAVSIEDAREQILWDIEYADYVLTTDGIVERNIV